MSRSLSASQYFAFGHFWRPSLRSVTWRRTRPAWPGADYRSQTRIAGCCSSLPMGSCRRRVSVSVMVKVSVNHASAICLITVTVFPISN